MRKKILTEFSKHPEADVLLFNFHCKNKTREEYIIPKWKRVRWYNSLRYGTYRIAVRTERVAAPTSLSLFCLAVAPVMAPGRTASFCTTVSGMASKFYACPIFLGEVSHQDSTWFHGYTQNLSRQRRLVRPSFPAVGKTVLPGLFDPASLLPDRWPSFLEGISCHEGRHTGISWKVL